MKKIVAVLLLILVILVSFPLLRGGGHTSHYKALGFVHSNTSDSAYMSFYRLEGTMVFKVNGARSESGQIAYSARLESGSATVWWEQNGTKSELFSIGPGEEFRAEGGALGKGTAYILVETDGPCQNGEFRFDLP